jgi:sugar lactone lactonase YvrE
MKRFNRVAQGLQATGQILALCTSLALTACGGGGGAQGPSTPPVVTPTIVAPSIGSQPLDAKVIDGATATFSVTASGSSLTYQWQRDGASIAGATGASYTTPVLRMADNGAKYQVVISGSNALVASSAATLTVVPIALSLTTQPLAQTAKDGDVVSFDVGATGSAPIQYQWQRNDVAIAGADKATYTTSALALADNGAVFKVVVTNPAGTVNSQEAKLTVTAAAPRIVTAPESVTTSDGASVTFMVMAAGSAPLAYQWLRNGSPISGATSASYAATLAYASSGDRFTVQISNGAGQVVSDAAVVTVNAAAPAITRQPADASIATGGSVSFTAAASGTAPLRYQWQQSQDEGLSWAAIPGATSASYSVSNATLADANTKLRVAVSNAAATLNSNAALLTVQANVRILAGTTGGFGYADGKGNAARFNYAWGMGADGSGNIYVTDGPNSVIRRISPDGTVKLYAGQPQVAARVDGTLAEARFTYPSELAVDRASGAVYVFESCVLRRIAGGIVSTFVGDGSCITRDGTGDKAGFASIAGMTVDADGNIYFTERANANGQLLRKVTPAGVVSTLAGSVTETGKADGSGSAARFSSIGRLAVDANKNLYVIDGTAIRQVAPTGEVSTYAGALDSWGMNEGYRTSARFGYMTGLAFDGRGNLFVADYQRIARISTNGMVVAAVSSTFDASGWTSVDGAAGTASAGNPALLTSMPDGGVAFFDSSAYTVRTMAANATVTTLAGGGRSSGFADAVGLAARFSSPPGYPNALVLSPTGFIGLADTGNHRLRRLALGTNLMDTLAGNGNYGADDGTAAAATFGSPVGLAYDAAGHLYIGDGNVIRRLSNTGVVSTVAGKYNESGCVDGVGAAARFGQIGAVVADSKGNLIVADMYNYVLRRVATDGTVTTLAGKAGQSGYVNGVAGEARLGTVRFMAIDAADNVYFTDYSHSIRKLAPNGEVSTMAGAPYANGFADDLGAFARFNSPAGLALDARGNLYVADNGNSAIRRITPGGYVSTVVGGGAGVESALQPGLGGRINQPTAIAVTGAGRLVFLSEGAVVGD